MNAFNIIKKIVTNVVSQLITKNDFFFLTEHKGQLKSYFVQTIISECGTFLKFKLSLYPSLKFKTTCGIIIDIKVYNTTLFY